MKIAATPFSASSRASATIFGTDVVALDCLGYTVALKQEVKRLVDRPVLLARSIVGRLAAEILE
jgi:hypothetical protein